MNQLQKYYVGVLLLTICVDVAPQLAVDIIPLENALCFHDTALKNVKEDKEGKVSIAKTKNSSSSYKSFFDKRTSYENQRTIKENFLKINAIVRNKDALSLKMI